MRLHHRESRHVARNMKGGMPEGGGRLGGRLLLAPNGPEMRDVPTCRLDEQRFALPMASHHRLEMHIYGP